MLLVWRLAYAQTQVCNRTTTAVSKSCMFNDSLWRVPKNECCTAGMHPCVHARAENCFPLSDRTTNTGIWPLVPRISASPGSVLGLQGPDRREIWIGMEDNSIRAATCKGPPQTFSASLGWEQHSDINNRKYRGNSGHWLVFAILRHKKRMVRTVANTVLPRIPERMIPKTPSFTLHRDFESWHVD